jgi:hypothetical protein
MSAEMIRELVVCAPGWVALTWLVCRRRAQGSDPQPERTSFASSEEVSETPASPNYALDFDPAGRAVGVFTRAGGVDLRHLSSVERVAVGTLIAETNRAAPAKASS